MCGLRKIKNRNELIKITKQNAHHDLVINGDAKIFGRSAYLCYNSSCIEAAFKKKINYKGIKNSYTAGVERKITKWVLKQ